MNTYPNILVVDDDELILEAIEKILVRRSYKVTLETTIHGALQQMARQNFDLLIVDLVLPDGDGLELIREIRSDNDVSIIIISGLGETTERIVGLEIGADDYISKPFDPLELLARIKCVLKRYRKSVKAPDEQVEKLYFEGWALDSRARSLSSTEGQEIEITRGEFDLLYLLASNSGQVLSREQIMDKTYGYATPAFDRSIDVKIGRLRKKIEPDITNPSIIKTVRGVGYAFKAMVKKTI